jgi:uncharacterized protein YaiE (UPF0345 family)
MFKTSKYFDGDVVSIAFQTATLPATVGVMAAGEYSFGTNQRETMSVVSGTLIVQQQGEDDWRTYSAGDSFVVNAGNSFKLKVEVETAYLCTYG